MLVLICSRSPAGLILFHDCLNHFCDNRPIVLYEREQDLKALQKLASLSWLEPERLDRLYAAMTLRKIKKHDVIFFEKEVANRVFLLLSGVAKLTFVGRDQERVLVALVAAGEIFGVSSLLTEMQRPFRCDAFTDCRVGTISPEQFVDIVLGIPFANFSRTMEFTVGRWWGMLLRYTSFLGLGLRERLAAALLELASKFGVRDARGTILSLPLTHEDLAELVGASRQRITEHLNEFERQQVIQREGRRLIVLPDRLADFVRVDTDAPPSGLSERSREDRPADKTRTTARSSHRPLPSVTR